MPRTGRGGKVSGAAGKAYANRSDLNVSKNLPIETAPNQTYGLATEQQAAQRAMPLQTANAAVPPAQPGAGPMGAAPSQPQAPMQVPTIDDMGDGHDSLRQELDSQGVANGVGGAYSQDPSHLYLLAQVQSMADGPFSSSAIRDLADFMKMMS